MQDSIGCAVVTIVDYIGDSNSKNTLISKSERDAYSNFLSICNCNGSRTGNGESDSGFGLEKGEAHARISLEWFPFSFTGNTNISLCIQQPLPLHRYVKALNTLLDLATALLVLYFALFIHFLYV